MERSSLTPAHVCLPRRSFAKAGTLALLAFLPLAFPLQAQVANQNPTGWSGIFNGQVNTGCSYDPYTGNATRSITDIAVAGAVGEYPLALVRAQPIRARLAQLRYLVGLAVGITITIGFSKTRQAAPTRTFSLLLTRWIFLTAVWKHLKMSLGILITGCDGERTGQRACASALCH